MTMMARRAMLATVVLAGVALASLGVAGTARAAGTGPSASAYPSVARGWGSAEEVPGTALLNKGGDAQVNAVSCVRAGDCGAGGYYTGRLGYRRAFVVSERNGRWLRAQELPGLAALNAGGNAQVSAVSCPRAGDCAAGGSYLDGSGGTQGFVVSQRNGRWLRAQEVPGLAALNVGGDAVVDSVSCAAAGNCGAGGSYQSSASPSSLTGDYPVQAFVASERSGRWAPAQEVPGTASTTISGRSEVVSMPAGSSRTRRSC
jgi:hypothetical protein